MTSGLTLMLLSCAVSADIINPASKGAKKQSNNTPILMVSGNNKQKNNNNKLFNKKAVVVSPNKNNKKAVVVTPTKQKQKTVVVQPGSNKKSNKKTVVIKPVKSPVLIQPIHRPWLTPIMPSWRHWRGGKVVIVDHHHAHYSAFAFAMTAMTIAIVIDQATDKPYTESGKPVTVKNRSCAKGEETQVVELDNELLIISCS